MEPSEFKALAFLDAHRGRKVSISFTPYGWKSYAKKHMKTSRLPIPDKHFGTNCTKALWDTGCHLHPNAFMLWLKLLETPNAFPMTTTRTELSKLISCGYTRKALSALQKERLIEAIIYRGGQTTILAVSPTPLSISARRHAKKQVRQVLLDPQGNKHYFYSNTWEFARKHGLEPTGVTNLVNGVFKSHRGWTLEQED